MRDLGQRVERDGAAVVFVNVALGGGALLAFGRRGAYPQRERGRAHELDKQHLGQVLADHLAAVLARVDLTQQHLGQAKHILAHGTALDHRVALIPLVEKDLDPLDAQHDIFKRTGLIA